MAVEHYENFPVASILMPRRLRRPVAAIYHFARAADDIADEGDLPDADRLRQLDNFRAELSRIAAGEAALTTSIPESGYRDQTIRLAAVAAL